MSTCDICFRFEQETPNTGRPWLPRAWARVRVAALSGSPPDGVVHTFTVCSIDCAIAALRRGQVRPLNAERAAALAARERKAWPAPKVTRLRDLAGHPVPPGATAYFITAIDRPGPFDHVRLVLQFWSADPVHVSSFGRSSGCTMSTFTAVEALHELLRIDEHGRVLLTPDGLTAIAAADREYHEDTMDVARFA